ncbi:MAG: sugar porter family MFS transporter [Opitutaceae bacterium]|jgi:MFS transporter, SP family, arabinose:H+ symporter|nr:sugar porter family MFS transporter [Opitutaceae bacterium]
MLYLILVAFVAALGGFLFGYDTAIISGTIGFVKTKFELDTVAEGWFVSSALVGCIWGVMFTGLINDWFGRKKALLLSGLLFLISAIGCMLAPTLSTLIIYRLIGGIGVGVASMTSPLFIAEISPPHLRGRLVTLYQLAITVGILLAYFANASLLELSTQSYETELFSWIIQDEVWRAMFGSECVPALLFFVLVLFIPESPRWLSLKKKDERAFGILARINGSEQAKQEMREIKDTIAHEAAPMQTLLKPEIRKPLIIGASLAFLTQICGVNAIIYYGPRILEEAGFALSDALGGQVIIGIVNVVFTLIAIWKIDQLGRRPLLIGGVSGIMFSLIMVGLLFFFEVTSGFWLMGFILMFIASFAFSFGPVIWTLLSEIYPINVRGTAMSIATLTLWTGTALVGQIVPWMLETLTPAGTFWIFSLSCVPALYLGIKVIPETKGKTLEEIEKFWLKG